MDSGQARSVKLRGEFLRKRFKEECCGPDDLILPEKLRGLSTPQSIGSYIMKTGKNWQFHLGDLGRYQKSWGIDISPCGKIVHYRSPHDEILQDLTSREFLTTFILKANYLVTMTPRNWIIYNSKDILELLTDSNFLKWRILESGRLKGDIYAGWGKRTILTIEYRAENHKRCFVVGAHGGDAGQKFGEFLYQQLLFNSIPIDYESWNE